MLVAEARCSLQFADVVLSEDHKVCDAKPPVIFPHAARYRHLRYHDLMHVTWTIRDQSCAVQGRFRWCLFYRPARRHESVAVCASDLVMGRLELDV